MRNVKEVPKPKVIRTTVVKFCKKNKLSVRQFVNNAKRTRLATTKDEEKMKKHLILWAKYNWI